MADFRQVSGQLEGLWKGAMEEAEAQGRIAGEAAGVEKVLKLVERLVEEYGGRGVNLADLKQHLAAEAPVIGTGGFGEVAAAAVLLSSAPEDAEERAKDRKAKRG